MYERKEYSGIRKRVCERRVILFSLRMVRNTYVDILTVVTSLRYGVFRWIVLFSNTVQRNDKIYSPRG